MIPLTVLETAGSTSDECWRRYEAGRRQPVAVMARQQGEGRGRHGRRWFTAPGGLAVSVLHFLPAARRSLLTHLPLETAVLTAWSIRRLTGLTPGLKWPNDLQLGDRKLGGILVESRTTAEPGPIPVVLGVGVNLGGEEASFPSDLAPGVAILATEFGTAIDPFTVAGLLLEAVESWFEGLGAGEGAA